MTIYEDEFDLYPYVLTLLKNWKLIIFLAFVAGAAALVFSLFQPRTYSSTSTIIGTYQRPVLTLSQEFSTVSNSSDVSNKRQAFLSIANSDAMAQAIFNQYTDQLPDDMTLKGFKKRVEIIDQGDAILVTASFEDSTLSADIANAWASQTVETINAAYGETQPLAPIQAQIVEAQADYLAAQEALEAFIENNQIAPLEQKINETQKILDILQSAQLNIIDQHLSIQVDLITAQADQYFDALSRNSESVFSKQVDEQLALLSNYAERKTALEILLTQAEALKEQLNGGNRSIAGDSGDALALFLARAQAFGFESDLTLDITLTDITSLQDTSANYVTDINRLIDQIKAEQVRVDDQLQELSLLLASGGDYQYYATPDAENPLFQAAMQSLDKLTLMDLPATLAPESTGTPLETQIEETLGEIQSLQALLEKEQATQRQLANERDLAEKAYQALLVKQTEIKSGSQSSNEVSLASSAIVNTDPDSRGTVTNTLLAGIVGGMLAVVWVFVSTWWKNQSEDSLEHVAA